MTGVLIVEIPKVVHVLAWGSILSLGAPRQCGEGRSLAPGVGAKHLAVSAVRFDQGMGENWVSPWDS